MTFRSWVVDNEDVYTVFDVCRSIYHRNYDKIYTVYAEQVISAELGVVIGTITESQKLIDHALESEEKGGQINMCTALEELKKEGIQEGIQKGIQEGIQKGRVLAYADAGLSMESIMQKTRLTREQIQKILEEE